MTTYAVAVTRTRRPAARRIADDRRASGLATAIMLLFALAGSLFVSAGSPHHQPTVPTAMVVAIHTGEAADLSPVSGHEHHYGNDWTPTLTKQPRPAAAVPVICIRPAQPCAPHCPAESATSPASDQSPREGLLLLSVLRV
jgi:hypothetical protein